MFPSDLRPKMESARAFQGSLLPLVLPLPSSLTFFAERYLRTRKKSRMVYPDEGPSQS